MADLPADVGTGIVRVRLRQVGLVSSDTPETSALPVRGKVVFTPNTPLLRHVGDGLLFPTKPVAAYLDANGDVSVELMATNDAQLEPMGWTYEVSFVLDNAEISPFHIVVVEGTDVELSDVTPVPPGTALPPSSGGVTDHGAHTGRSAADQHPMSAITGLDAALAGKATAAQGAKADAAIPSGLVDAKGDLIVGTADNTVTRLPAGTNGHVLTLDSAESTGVKWAAPPEGGGLAGVGVSTIWAGSQAAYDAITTPDPDTLYFVTG